VALQAGGLLTLGDGSATTQNVTATGAIIDLNAAGVTENSNSVVNGNSLRLQGTGTFALTQAGNAVSTLAASVTGPLTFRDSLGLLVGGVLGTNRVNSNGSNVALQTAGLLTLGDGSATAENVTATGAIVDLNAAGITENSNSDVNGDSLRLQGTARSEQRHVGNAGKTRSAKVNGPRTIRASVELM